MNDYVIRQQKKMRRGFTTGTCAAAAAKGAVCELLTGLKIRKVTVRLPSGERPELSVYPVNPDDFEVNGVSPDTVNSDSDDPGLTASQSVQGGIKTKPACDAAAEESGTGYYCIKDAGDDPDVTDKAKIFVFVKWISENRIPENAFQDAAFPDLVLTGGPGVGKVTKPGLEQKVGQAAINRVPRRMIFESVQEVLDSEREDPEYAEESEETTTGTGKKAHVQSAVFRYAKETEETEETEAETDAEKKDIFCGSLKNTHRQRKLLITVCVQNGEEIAQKTFNPKLGISGGISILGTTGIVEPMNEAALVATIEVEIRQTLNQGQKNLLFVPGNYGEKYVRNDLHLPDIRMIQCSNYVGDAIDLAVAYKAESILFVGNFGKLVKLAAGIMNTHSRYADGRWEIVAAHAGLQGADTATIEKIRHSITTDQMLSSLETDEQRQTVTESIIRDIDVHLKHRAGKVPIGAIIYSERYGFLGQTEEAGKLKAQFVESAGGSMQ